MLVNLKGGVAKTTSAVAIAECLASEGHRTLLIDADHQCMSGELLLGEDRQLKCERTKRNLHDLLAAMLDAEFTVSQFESFVTQKVSNIDGGLAKLAVLPCSIRISSTVTGTRRTRQHHRHGPIATAWASMACPSSTVSRPRRTRNTSSTWPPRRTSAGTTCRNRRSRVIWFSSTMSKGARQITRLDRLDQAKEPAVVRPLREAEDKNGDGYIEIRSGVTASSKIRHTRLSVIYVFPAGHEDRDPGGGRTAGR